MTGKRFFAFIFVIVCLVALLVNAGTLFGSILYASPAVGERLVDSLGGYPESTMIYTGELHSKCGSWRSDDVGIVSESDDDLEDVQSYYEEEMQGFCQIAQGFTESSYNCDVDPWIAYYAPPISGSICLSSACYLKAAPREHLSVTLISDSYQSADTTIVEIKSSSYPTADEIGIPCGE